LITPPIAFIVAQSAHFTYFKSVNLLSIKALCTGVNFMNFIDIVTRFLPIYNGYDSDGGNYYISFFIRTLIFLIIDMRGLVAYYRLVQLKFHEETTAAS
jgi:hypothetical protein